MTTLRLRGGSLAPEPDRPLVMGIVNASPESFSRDGDGDLRQQVERAKRLLDEGADLIDVGGESGVTNRPPITSGEEIRRVAPLVEALVDLGAVVSVDTWKAPVVRAALDAGAHLINDVSGLRDPAIAQECGRAGAGLVVMHTRATPKVKSFPRYTDVVHDVVRFLASRVEAAVQLGVARDAIVVDPGPDFAKTPAETIATIRALPRVAALGHPILLAVSRKDFIGALTDRLPRERGAGTLAAIGAGLDLGASILRVHEVAATVDYLAVRSVLRGASTIPPDLSLDEHLRREPAASA
jgi:dihydropteroate synthase